MMFKMDLKIRNINIDVPVLSNPETTTINCKVEGKYLLQCVCWKRSSLTSTPKLILCFQRIRTHLYMQIVKITYKSSTWLHNIWQYSEPLHDLWPLTSEHPVNISVDRRWQTVKHRNRLKFTIFMFPNHFIL